MTNYESVIMLLLHGETPREKYESLMKLMQENGELKHHLNIYSAKLSDLK